MTPSDLGEKTIKDFGDQWTAFSDTSGYFGSAELFVDFVAPFDAAEIVGKRVADLGAGTGRHVSSLLELGAAHVVAIEPSEAVKVIEGRFSDDDRVTILKVTGDSLPQDLSLDAIFSIGVIHHIPDPIPVIRSAYSALRQGGKLVVWLYGREGSRVYLTFAVPLRAISKRLPLSAVAVLARILDVPLAAYISVCSKLPWRMPLKDYMLSVLAKLPAASRRLVIYDQLKPSYAKYYTRQEAISLMRSAPFHVDAFHRRGYSWLLIGTKLTTAHRGGPIVSFTSREIAGR